MASALIAILSIAASVGMSYAWQKIYQKKVQDNNVSNSDILNATEDVLKRAANFGAGKLTSITNALYAIPNIQSMSPAVRKVLEDARDRLSDKYKTVEKAMTDVQSKANQLSSRTANLIASSDEYRTSVGGAIDMKEIQQKAQQLQGDLKHYEQKIQ